MSLTLGTKHVCNNKFSIGKDAMSVYVAEGEVAVVKNIAGLNMYYIHRRYLTYLAYGKYFTEVDSEEVIDGRDADG